MGRIAVFLIVLLPILIAVKIAKDGRKSCAWPLGEAKGQMVGAVLMIALSQVSFLPWEGIPWFLRLRIISASLLWYGVYRLARAIYRKRDLKNEKAA